MANSGLNKDTENSAGRRDYSGIAISRARGRTRE
jgi:hypothetical protein